MAFYGNDVETFAKLRAIVTLSLTGSISLDILSYFDEDVFRSLDSSLQQCWLVDRMRFDLLFCDCTADIRILSLEFLHRDVPLRKEMVVLPASMCFAAGDSKGLDEIACRFGDSILESAAYRDIVQGNVDEARLKLDQALSLQKKGTKNRTLDYFSETIRLLLAFRQLPAKKVLEQIDTICKSIAKSWPSPLDEIGWA